MTFKNGNEFSAGFAIDWFFEGLAGGRHCAVHVVCYAFQGSIFVPGGSKVFLLL